MTKEEIEITEIVNPETRAWDTQDVNLLISVFHPDMVWPWPQTFQSHDPIDWIMPLGRYNKERWCKGWQDLFDTHRWKGRVCKVYSKIGSEWKMTMHTGVLEY